MVIKKREILSESEVNRIRGLYGIGPVRRQYVFEACISVNEKYFIMNDEVFDIQEKTLLGNLWESLDIFKTIFQNVKIVNEEYQHIRESIINLPITESKEDLQQIKKLMLEFDFMKDTWVGNQLSKAGKGISDTVSQSWEGLKNFGISVSKGDWSEIVSLLGKGVLFILRKLKDAMYSTVGMIVDAILVATGIGKGAQVIAWGLITALDAYQLYTGDYEGEEKNDPMWLKLLFFGFDILGLVSAGAAAKKAKESFNPIKAIAHDPGAVAKYLEKSPKLKGIISTIVDGAKKVPELLTKISDGIATKFPAGSKFINSIMGGLTKLLTKVEESLGKMIGQKGAEGVLSGSKEGLKTGATLYTFDKGSKLISGGVEKVASEIEGLSDIDKQNLQAFSAAYGNAAE